MHEKYKDTSVFLDSDTSRKLSVVAKANERSKAGQIRFMVNQEYERLQSSSDFSSEKKQPASVNEVE